MNPERSVACAAVAILLGAGLVSPVHAQAAPAGRIKSVSGAVFLVRAGTSTPANPGDAVLEADGIRTGADGRIGFTLRDETRISLGPNSDIRLDQFLFAPGQRRFGFALRIIRGAIAYVSGRIAKLAPDSVRLQTPTAILGVRGTRLVIRVDTP
jgi:hypothetical protein